MTQTDSPDLVPALQKAKSEMMKSSQSLGVAGRWDEAQARLQMARDLDGMLVGIGGNGSAHNLASTRSAPPVQTYSPRPAKLPYFYVDGNKLAKIGPSRDGTTYEHRVTREHYDQMIQALAAIAAKSKTFETPELTRAVDIPKHEPLILLAMLEEQKLLINWRRGRWVFTNAETFKADAEKVWSGLPRQ